MLEFGHIKSKRHPRSLLEMDDNLGNFPKEDIQELGPHFLGKASKEVVQLHYG
jgi:hypothetical protein